MSNTFKKIQDLPRNEWWLAFLVLVSVGTMIFCFIGCGSDSTPKGAANEKKAKAAKSADAMKVPVPLLTDKGAGVGESGKVAEAGPKRLELPPGYTQEELDARHEQQRKRFNNGEIVPGLTQAEMEARHEQQRRKFKASNIEIAPGITQAELAAKHAEQRKKFYASGNEVLPGLTQEQLNSKMKQQAKPEGRELSPPSAGK
jgi:hypothetical protein